ncbi:MAG: PaaI family thioesterase [Candidatus Delongbacteria bacterium]|jgi:uncharacterized protein (TIGR00369 family)|nr:PaaI family thioesterase [Candidatus Delongbacteria bacterium]
MKLEEDKHCFVCGDLNEIGLHVDFTVNDDNSATAKIKVPQNFQGWKDIVHGGIISTLLDEVSIYACRKISQKGVTAEIKVKFKKPIPVETELTLQARVVDHKRKLIMVEAELLVDDVVYASAETKVFNLE